MKKSDGTSERAGICSEIDPSKIASLETMKSLFCNDANIKQFKIGKTYMQVTDTHLTDEAMAAWYQAQNVTRQQTLISRVV